ncbi:hypothetical protein Tco_1349782 [Tanacetum coccineum]
MVINSPCLNSKKELAIPEQTATGKESTNPLMADSLPKTIMPTKLVKPQGFNLRPNMGPTNRLARLYLNGIVARHGVPISIISDHDSRFTSSYHSIVRCAPFEALYGRKCHSSIMWDEVGEGHLIGPELVQETTEKIS